MVNETSYEVKFKLGEKTVIVVAPDWGVLTTGVTQIERDDITFNVCCPWCNHDLEHNYQEDDGAGYSEDVYICYECNTSVTYIAPNQYGEYHEVPDSETTFIVDLTETVTEE